MKAISQINQADSGGAAPSGASANLPKSSPPPIAPSMGASQAPIIQGTQAASPGQQIAGTLAAVTGRPIVAQVVSSQVSSQQALDRRTNVAATFG